MINPISNREEDMVVSNTYINLLDDSRVDETNPATPLEIVAKKSSISKIVYFGGM